MYSIALTIYKVIATCIAELNVSRETRSSVSLLLGTVQTLGNNFVPFVYQAQDVSAKYVNSPSMTLTLELYINTH